MALATRPQYSQRCCEAVANRSDERCGDQSAVGVQVLCLQFPDIVTRVGSRCAYFAGRDGIDQYVTDVACQSEQLRLRHIGHKLRPAESPVLGRRIVTSSVTDDCLAKAGMSSRPGSLTIEAVCVSPYGKVQQGACHSSE